MAAVITLGTKYGKKVFQASRITYASVAFDGSYPTGGEDIATLLAAKAMLPGHQILHVEALPDGTYDFAYNHATGKLMAFVSSTGAEVANEFDLSALTAVALVIWSE